MGCVERAITWFNANSSAVVALATIMLAVLTGVYVLLNRSIAQTNKKIARYMKDEFDLKNRPYIGIASQKGVQADNVAEYKFEFVLQNYGTTPGLLTKVTFLEYKTSEDFQSIDFDKNCTIFPGQKIAIISKANKGYCTGKLGMRLFYEANRKPFQAEFVLEFDFATCNFKDTIKSTTT